MLWVICNPVLWFWWQLLVNISDELLHQVLIFYFSKKEVLYYGIISFCVYCDVKNDILIVIMSQFSGVQVLLTLYNQYPYLLLMITDTGIILIAFRYIQHFWVADQILKVNTLCMISVGTLNKIGGIYLFLILGYSVFFSFKTLNDQIRLIKTTFYILKLVGINSWCQSTPSSK